MASHDPDIDKLTSLLGQCLGRIDAEAFKLQENGEDVDFDTGDRLEDETSKLQDLIDSLLVIDMGSDEANVNSIVSRVVNDCLQDLEVPIVLRQTLTDGSSLVAAPSSLVTVAVQRAMALGLAPLGPGDEVRLTTRVEGDAVVFEIESLGSQSHAGNIEHSETLREFVEGFGGSCQVRCVQQDLFLVLELPQVMVTDRSESR